MANAADEAQVIEEMDRSIGLQLVQQQMRSGVILETAKNCSECGEMIPSARQVANPGCQYCTRCAGELELQARRARGMRLALV